MVFFKDMPTVLQASFQEPENKDITLSYTYFNIWGVQSPYSFLPGGSCIRRSKKLLKAVSLPQENMEMVGEGRHLTRPTNKLIRMKIGIFDLYLLQLSMPDFHTVYGLTIMFSSSNNAMTAYNKNLIFGLCSTIPSKYFSFETLVSFDKPSLHFSHNLPFLSRNRHSTSQNTFLQLCFTTKKKNMYSSQLAVSHPSRQWFMQRQEFSFSINVPRCLMTLLSR